MQCRKYKCKCGHEAWIDCTPRGCEDIKKPVVKCEKCGQMMSATDVIMFAD